MFIKVIRMRERCLIRSLDLGASDHATYQYNQSTFLYLLQVFIQIFLYFILYHNQITDIFSMKSLYFLLKTPRIIIPTLLYKPSFQFCSNESLKQRLKKQKIQKQKPKSQIVSLLSDQLDQLSKLSHYSTSVDLLQKNHINKSYDHLRFALTQAKARFPQSINLHMFLLNRVSILQKVVGEQGEFVDTLEQIFFMCLSLKGDRSLQTLKHLQNYIISLITHKPEKLPLIMEYLQEQNLQKMLKKCQYLVGISKFINNQKQKGIKILQECKEDSIPKQYRLNNLGWLKILAFTNEKFQLSVQEKQKLSEELLLVLNDLIIGLVQSQKRGQLKSSTKQIQKNLVMTTHLEEYLQKKGIDILSKIRPKTLLLNSQSHIISMNIAYTLYLMNKLNQSNIFVKIALQSSIQLQQPYRIGLGIVLLSKINYKMKLNWEQTVLDLLSNKKIFSKSVIKHCLFAYSQFLFMDHRFYEAEAYANQVQTIQDNLYIEGLVLPDYDFTF